MSFDIYHWPDGAKLTRLLDDADFRVLIQPLLPEGLAASFREGSVRNYTMFFAYVDPRGQPQAGILLSQEQDRRILNDVCGPNQGKVLDPRARSRVVSVLSDWVEPLHSQIGLLFAWRLQMPRRFDKQVFQRMRWRPKRDTLKWGTRKTRQERRDVLRELESWFKTHWIKRLGFGSVRSPSKTIDTGSTLVVIWNNSGRMLGPDGFLQLTSTINNMGQITHTVQRFNCDEVLEILGSTTQGPLELLVDLGLAASEVTYDAWLEGVRDQDDRQLVAPVEAFELLGLTSPVFWPSWELREYLDAQ